MGSNTSNRQNKQTVANQGNTLLPNIQGVAPKQSTTASSGGVDFFNQIPTANLYNTLLSIGQSTTPPPATTTPTLNPQPTNTLTQAIADMVNGKAQPTTQTQPISTATTFSAIPPAPNPWTGYNWESHLNPYPTNLKLKV